MGCRSMRRAGRKDCVRLAELGGPGVYACWWLVRQNL